MSRKAKSTGLGTDAFFTGKTGAATAADPGGKDGEKKMRTTIMLSPDVVAGIETLRTQARRSGTRLTTSRIIEDALRLLMRERKIEV
jgi:hypothetical protein